VADIGKVGAEVVVQPIAEVSKEIAKRVDWTLIGLVLIGVFGALGVVRAYWRQRRLASAAQVARC